MCVAGDRPDNPVRESPLFVRRILSASWSAYPPKNPKCQKGPLGWQECLTRKSVLVDEGNNKTPTTCDTYTHMPGTLCNRGIKLNFTSRLKRSANNSLVEHSIRSVRLMMPFSTDWGADARKDRRRNGGLPCFQQIKNTWGATARKGQVAT